MAEKRKQFFPNKPCLLCGKTGEQIHHKKPEEKKSHNIWSWSENNRNEELKKCVVLCRSCHVGLHSRQRRRRATERAKTVHNYNTYNKHGCRCAVCKKAKAIVRLKYIAGQDIWLHPLGSYPRH
jgi:hypothetical protein